MLNRSMMLSLSVCLLGSFVPAFVPEAHADKIFARIPAAACQPTTASDAEDLELSNGSWVFVSGQSGTATLWCPVVHDVPWDMFSTFAIDIMRMWYRDPDGTADNALVTAELFHRPVDSSNLTSVGFITSDTSNTMTSNNLIDTTITDTATDALHIVKVTLFRSDNESVAFHGVDFQFNAGS